MPRGKAARSTVTTAPNRSKRNQPRQNRPISSNAKKLRGTTLCKFKPQIGPVECDMLVKKDFTTRFQTITAMKQYEDKSLQELRYEDYLANRGKPTTCMLSPFSFPAAVEATGPFNNVLGKKLVNTTTVTQQLWGERRKGGNKQSAKQFSKKAKMTREGTMRNTAKEASAWLGTEKLVGTRYGTKFQSKSSTKLSERPPPKKAKLTREGTMMDTAKEASAWLGSEKLASTRYGTKSTASDKTPDSDTPTRGACRKRDMKSSDGPPNKKAKLAREGTMKDTAKAASAWLGSEKLVSTRHGTKSKAKSSTKQPGRIQKTLKADKQPGAKATIGARRNQGKKKSVPPPKKTKLARVGTMTDTAKEARSLLGPMKLGGTRQNTRTKAKPSIKRAGTIQQTMEEATQVLKDGNLSGTKRTRAPGKATQPPPMRRAGTMQKTAKEGKEFVKRRRQKRAT